MSPSLFRGVEKILDVGGQIIFENIFGLRHYGRVADLILMELRPGLPENFEARLRAAMDLLICGCWSYQTQKDQRGLLQFEVGHDQKKIAFSVGFRPQTVPKEGDASGIALWLKKLNEFCDVVEVRFQNDAQQCEILVSIDKQNRELGEREPIRWVDVSIAESSPGEAQPAGVPKVSLAQLDLDAYKKAEQQDRERRFQDQNLVVEEQQQVVKGDFSEAPLEAVTISGDPSASDEVLSVSGSPGEAESQTVISGAPVEASDGTEKRFEADALAALDEEIRRVTGGDQGAPDQTKTTIRGSSPQEDLSETRFSSQKVEGPNQEKIVISSEAPLEEKAKRVLSKMGGKKSQLSAVDRDIIRVAQETGQSEDDLVLLLSTDESAESVDRQEWRVAAAELKTVTQDSEKHVREADGLLSKSAIEFEASVQKTTAIVDKMPLPDKLKEHLLKVVEDLQKNRHELELNLRDINGKWRKSQLDLANQQSVLSQALEKSDLILRQKESALVKSKEMLARSSSALERYKQQVASSHSQDSARKESQMQAVMNKMREQVERAMGRVEEANRKASQESAQKAMHQQESSKLHRQVEELSRKLADLQKSKAHALADTVGRDELERAERQLEELKKQNKLLQDRLAQAQQQSKNNNIKAGSSSKADGELTDTELKHKLEQQTKLYSSLKADFDKNIKRLEEAKQAETKLRVEISKLQTELKAAQKQAKKAA